MQPANFTSPPASPDAPDHLPSRCPECKGFLKRDWDWEAIPDEKVIAWFVKCRKCGFMVVVER